MEIKGYQAIEYLNSKKSLLNSVITEIKIYFEVNLKVCLNIEAKNMTFNVLFEEVKELSFYHNDNYLFYNVENYKLIYSNNEDEFYLSLDPYDDDQNINSLDKDFIRAKKLIVIDSKTDSGFK
jgi:hypothetical protein